MAHQISMVKINDIITLCKHGISQRGGEIKGVRYNYESSPRGTITTPAGGVVFIPDVAEKNGGAVMANKCRQMG